VALLSSTLPFLLDMFAMRHLPPSVFGVLLSASPAAGAIAGWLVLGETLSLLQCVGIAAIAAACGGRFGGEAKVAGALCSDLPVLASSPASRLPQVKRRPWLEQ
jgi:threonine/homoserine efflux transporter RhtA